MRIVLIRCATGVTALIFLIGLYLQTKSASENGILHEVLAFALCFEMFRIFVSYALGWTSIESEGESDDGPVSEGERGQV